MFWFELSSDPYRQTAKQPCSSKLGSSNASGQVNVLNLAQSLIDTETVTVPKYFSSVPDNSLGYIIPWLVGLSGHDPNVDHEKWWYFKDSEIFSSYIFTFCIQIYFEITVTRKKYSTLYQDALFSGNFENNIVERKTRNRWHHKLMNQVHVEPWTAIWLSNA